MDHCRYADSDHAITEALARDEEREPQARPPRIAKLDARGTLVTLIAKRRANGGGS